MMENDKFKNYLLDIGREIVDLARAVKDEATHSKADYDKGRLFSYYEILSRMQQEAKGFAIDSKDLGLENVELSDFLPIR